MDIVCLALFSILIGTERYCIVEDGMRHRGNQVMGIVTCFEYGKQESEFYHRQRVNMCRMHALLKTRHFTARRGIIGNIVIMKGCNDYYPFL